MRLLKKRAFTLLEVLISITLLSLVLMALYRSADILRNSNKNLFKNLKNTSQSIKGAKTLYLDLIESDGNLTITHIKKFHSIGIERTKHSLYGLYKSKVVWLIYKEDNTLLRIEGNNYDLPLKDRDNVNIDVINRNMELFKVYPNKKNNKVFVIMKKINQVPQSFMISNLNINLKTYRKNDIHIQVIGGSGADTKKKKEVNMLN